jgi:hypothetical protein
MLPPHARVGPVGKGAMEAGGRSRPGGKLRGRSMVRITSGKFRGSRTVDRSRGGAAG